MQKARKINRIKRNLSSYLSGIGNKNYNQGVMTGYSVPINQNVFSQVGIYPRNYNNAINQPSSFSNCNTDLFSMPSGNELYYTDGRFFRNSGGLEGKTGVKIIYD